MMTGDCSRTMIQSIQLGSQKYLWMRIVTLRSQPRDSNPLFVHYRTTA
jgi:hypothetical protein